MIVRFFLIHMEILLISKSKNIFCCIIFPKETSSNDGNSLLVLDISRGICVFTALDITLDIKYFFSPNISHSLFSEIRIAHTNNINNRIVKYVIVDSDAYYLPYYSSLLYKNYDLIDEYPKPQGGSNQLLFKRK